MVGLPSTSIDSLWRLLDLPIGWINAGIIDPELKPLLEYLELILLALVLGLVVIVLWDVTSSLAREQERRKQQEQWRRQLQERKRRLRFERRSQNGERVTPTR
jgi:hypothetical protein